jgi:ribonucleoside-diphosphate reductase alpha chain
MNISKYDEWKDTDAVEILTYFLDAVMTDFIAKARELPYMERAVRFAERHRAIGIGAVGYHTYLQSRMVPFESVVARTLNKQIFKNIQEKSYLASAELATWFGANEFDGVLRNTTTMAVAPTKSSAFILGQISEGIEPHASNYYIKDLQKGKYTIRNPHLMSTLERRGLNTEAVWESILANQGSVQHLDLDDYEKMVYKTFSEISPMEIVTQAADRQKFIDQSQSLNLMIDPDRTTTKDMNALVLEAWRLGVKSLYYQIGFNAAKSYTQSADILSCAVCEA